MGGVISVIGFLAGSGDAEQPSMLEALTCACIVRGILIGARDQFEAMNLAIDANDIHPIVDEKVFGLDDALEAYDYQSKQKNYGKVVIRLA
jgi:NADPH:quinone reductase-like Zn-dependent oxidoreductase